MRPLPQRRAGVAARRRGLAALARGLLLALCGGVAWLPPAMAADRVALIHAAKPSIVAVGTYNPLDNPRFTFRGTGFVVGNGRQVLTNWHVLPPPAGSPGAPASAAALALLWPGADPQSPELRQAQLVRGDADHDLALLELAGAPLPALALDSGALVAEGDEVLLMGFPLGSALGVSVVSHRGMVSAVTPVAIPPAHSGQLDARTAQRLRQGPFPVYQLDATSYPGSSGSPLLDVASGRVVGIVNMAYVKGTKESALATPSGICYAIPVRHAVALLAGSP